MPFSVKKKNRISAAILAVLPLLAVVFAFEVIPLFKLLISSFQPDVIITSGFSFDNYIQVFTSQDSLLAFRNSILIAVSSTVIGLVIAFAAIRAVRKSPARTRKRFTALFSVVSNFSGIPLAFSFMILLGNAGIIKKIFEEVSGGIFAFDLYSELGLMMLYIFFQIPLAALLLMPAFDAVSSEMEESSMMLGASDTFFWRKVGLPVMLPSVCGTVVILFANAVCAYATAYALLMNNFPLLSLNISAAYTGDMVSRPGLGAAMSVILMLTVCIVNALAGIIMKRSSSWMR
jgi:putative spermidine/putrescine transport system permease protein